jgi:hypothetical protein
MTTDNRRTYLHKLRLGTCDTLLATFDKNFVRFELFTCPALAILRRLARERDFDTVLFLQPNGVFTILADERGVVLVGNLENFKCLVGLDAAV